jgi:DNA-binding HxlR family transcriptional regulator
MATNLKAKSRPRRGQQADEQTDVSSGELLELLGDPYTRCVLTAVVDAPKSGSDIVEETDVSKATVYRRLEELCEAGIVESRTVFDPDGHHHEEFESVVDSVAVDFDDGTLSAEVDPQH